MTKTTSGYIPDLGEVVITISAANVTAVAAFTTAEDIILDGTVRSFRRTNNPEKPLGRTNVTGDNAPILTRSTRQNAEERWELVLVDDYSEGAAGEWGTDNLSAVEIFMELLDNDQDPGGLACTPAGGATGDIEYTLTNPRLLYVSVPEIDADTEELAVVTVGLAAEAHTTAAHS